MSNNAQGSGFVVDLRIIETRISGLQNYAELIKHEIDLLHQLLPALQSPSLPGLDLSSPPRPEIPQDAAAIKAWRKRQGLTQERAAARLGMTASHLSRLENSRVRMTDAILYRIGKAFAGFTPAPAPEIISAPSDRHSPDADAAVPRVPASAPSRSGG